jgi:PAS domain S-box-containing protein
MEDRTRKTGQPLCEHIETGRQVGETGRSGTEALRDSEERFRTIFDSVNDAIFIHDLKTGVILDVNQRMCEMYGFSREESLHLRAGDSSSGEPPYTEQDALNWIRKAAGGEPQVFEWHAKHRTGRLFWVEVNMRRATIGGKERLLVSVRDITDRKQAEEILQEYEKAVEASQDMIATVDRDYRYRLANAAFLKYRGTSKKKVIGRSVAEILGRDVFEQVVKGNLDRCFRGEVVHYEMKHTYPDLGERELSVSYLPISGSDGIGRVTTVIRDITEQRHAEASLRQSEERYRNIFDNAVMGIFQSTPEGRYLRANSALARTYGYESSEEMIESVTDIGAQQYVNPEDRVRLMEACAAHGFVEGFESQMYRKDGIQIWVSANVRAVRDAQGSIVYYEGTHKDITSRKQAEEELRISKNRLSKAEIISRSGNWEFDLESKRVFASDGARKIYGLPNTEWTVPEVQEIPLPEYRSMLDRRLMELIKENSPYDVEFKIRRLDSGETIDIHSVAEYDRHRNVVFGVIQDITARKMAEEALRKSEEKYRLIVDTAGEGIAVTDENYRFTFVNARFAEMLGRNPEEITGKKVDAFIFEEDMPRVLEGRRRRRQGIYEQFERRFRRKDGDRKSTV